MRKKWTRRAAISAMKKENGVSPIISSLSFSCLSMLGDQS